MKNGPIYFKWSVILFIVIILLLVFRGCICGDGGKSKGSKIDTITVTKTVTVEKIVKDTAYVPIPSRTVYLVQYKTDTLETTEYIKADTAAILKDYHATRFYLDTIYNPYGYVAVADTVNRNLIAGRGTKTVLNIPTITNTVTLKAPNRVTLYAGGGLFGNQNDPIWGIEGHLGLQFRNKKTYSIGYMLNKTGDPLYSFRFSLPIKLKR